MSWPISPTFGLGAQFLANADNPGIFATESYEQILVPAEICAHSFCGTGIAEYLRNSGGLDVAARIAGHESTRTTQLYNRLREEIERIHV